MILSHNIIFKTSVNIPITFISDLQSFLTIVLVTNYIYMIKKIFIRNPVYVTN